MGFISYNYERVDLNRPDVILIVEEVVYDPAKLLIRSYESLYFAE